ncbi:MAG: hypothetical protein QXT77_00145 [Candidatus Methanomethylicaceae archaeon]
MILALPHQEIVGQNRNFLPVRVATAQRYAAEIKIDSRLDEPVWNEIEPITDFTQRKPDEGQPADEIGADACGRQLVNPIFINDIADSVIQLVGSSSCPGRRASSK